MQVVILSPFPAERGALDALLRDEGHDVRCAASRDAGLALVALSRPDALIADAQLLGVDGIEVIRGLSQRGPVLRTILLCTRSSPVCDQPGMVRLTKPIDLAELFRNLAPREPMSAAAR